MSNSGVAKRLLDVHECRRPKVWRKAMKYLCLIYEDEKAWQNLSKAEMEKGVQEYWVFGDSIKKSGNYVGGNALQPTNTASPGRVTAVSKCGRSWSSTARRHDRGSLPRRVAPRPGDPDPPPR